MHAPSPPPLESFYVELGAVEVIEEDFLQGAGESAGDEEERGLGGGSA